MKAVKFQILKPVDEGVTWKDFGAELRSIQFESAKALNYCMTQWYFWQVDKERIKGETGKYPGLKELPTPEKRLYKDVRGMYPLIGSQTVSEVVRASKQRWQTDVRDCFYRLDKSLPTFKKTQPVMIHGQQYKFEREGGDFVIRARLRPREKDGQKTFRFMLATKKVHGGKMAVLERLFSGEYKKSAMKIKFESRKRKWFAIFTYEPEKEEVSLDPEVVVGVDLGVVNTYYAAASNSMDRINQEGSRIREFKTQMDKRKRLLSKGGKASGRGGRGRTVKIEPVLKLGDKFRRFRDSLYHWYSNDIVNFALKTGAGTIQFENLDGLMAAKVDHFILKDWTIGDLHTKLEYKAKEKGIVVRYVNPRYTSQRCSECGHIARGNRPDQSTFKCQKCDWGHDPKYPVNADYNAARNLTVIGIEDEVVSTLRGYVEEAYPDAVETIIKEKERGEDVEFFAVFGDDRVLAKSRKNHAEAWVDAYQKQMEDARTGSGLEKPAGFAEKSIAQ